MAAMARAVLSNGAPAAWELVDEDVEEPTAGLPDRCLDFPAESLLYNLQLLDLPGQNEWAQQPRIPKDGDCFYHFTGGIQDAAVALDGVNGVKREEDAEEESLPEDEGGAESEVAECGDPMVEPADDAPSAELAEDMAPAAPAEDLMMSGEVLWTYMSVPASSTVVSGTFTAARGADGKWQLVLKPEP